MSGIAATNLEVHQITHAHSIESSHAGVTIHKSDFSPTSLKSLLVDITPDLIFSTQSAGSYDFQKQLIDAAVQSGILRFVAAEFGQDCLNQKVQERLPPYKEKAQVTQYLREQSSIEWIGVATGCYPLEHALISGNLGLDLKWQSATIPGSGNERFAASSSAWVGSVARALITNWEDIKNQHLYASGMIISGNEIVQCLQTRTGQEWEIGNVEVADMVCEAERRFERGFPDAGMFLMERSVLYDESLEALRPFVEKDAKAKLGLTGGEDLEHVIQRVVHEHKHHGKGDCGCE